MASNAFRVGESPPRPDGADKVTGRALFVDDIAVAGLWHAATVRCPHAKARIVSIDLSRVHDDEAVVITAKDLPGPNAVRAIADDWRVLADGVANHAFEAVALVAAPTRERAWAAAQAIAVAYEPLPAVLSYEEALAEGKAGVLSRCQLDHGDAPAALGRSDVLIVEGTYETGHQEHIYLETHGIVADAKSDGSVEVFGSLQCPFYVQKALKYLLGTDQVRVRQVTTGGGFGGKEDCPSLVAAHAVLLSRRAGHPVKVIYDRHEDIVATSKRHPSRVHIKSAALRDGTLLAHDIDILFDGGAYITMSPVVLSRGLLHAPGPYRCPNVRIRATALRTNTCPNGAFRGFGAPQTQFAMERQMDRIARALGLDPLTVRERNALVEGDTTATGQLLDSGVAARECLAVAAQRTNFRERWLACERERRLRQASDGRPQRGLGLSLFWHGSGFTGNGEKRISGKVGLRLNEQGLVDILISSTDLGQGTLTVFLSIVATAGLPASRLRVQLPDTARVPDSGPTVASRTVMVVGELAERAARQMVDKLRSFAVEAHAASGVELVFGRTNSDPELELKRFDGLVRSYLAAHGPLLVETQYQPLAGQDFDEVANRGMAYSAFGWGCDVVEVEVDPDTLETRPIKVTAVADVGRAIHPVLCAGQVEGGTLQALGWGYLEEVKMSAGRYQNDRLATYIIPTTRDAPELETVLLEHPAKVGPHGAKGVGEMPLDGGAPALLGAIENATGVQVSALPASPERIYEARAQGHVVAPAESSR
jgi:CO/xanthine dehydrogenase Mo-binding subunit